MNMVFIGGREDLDFGTPETSYEDTVWEGSPSQRALRMAYAAGIDKILLHDNAFKALVKWGTALVGSDNDSSDGIFNRFSSESALDAYVKKRLQKYCYENGFYGIVLNDEPVAKYTDNLGAVYRSIKRVAKSMGIEVYIHLNLLPADVELEMLGDTSVTTDRDVLYRSYITNILKATQADRLSLDIYPFMDWGFKSGYFSMLQIFKSCCDEYNAEMSLCVQSFSGGSYRGGDLGLEEMYHQLNTAVGMGIRDIYFYTYMPDGEEQFDTNASFVDEYGNPTAIYGYAKQVIEELQAFADTVLSYDFNGMRLVYTNSASEYYHFENYVYLDPNGERCLSFDNTFDFEKLETYEVSNDIALVTELYNEETRQYMYMVQNVVDPYYYENRRQTWWDEILGRGFEGWKNENLTVTLDFGDNCKGVIVWYCGEETYVSLTDGIYELTLGIGMASYIIPVY